MVWFLFGILCCCLFLIGFAYIKMNALNKAVNVAYQRLDLATKDRAALIDNLIDAVKNVEDMDPVKLEELENLKQVPAEWDKRVAREDDITRHLKYVFTVTRDHPEVELSTAFEKLQNRVIKAEGDYRKNKSKYNTAVHSFYVFGELIPFNWICWAMEMAQPQYFTTPEQEHNAQLGTN